MNGENFILGYVRECASGHLALSDCGPVWQLGIIGALLIGAIMLLTISRILPLRQSQEN